MDTYVVYFILKVLPWEICNMKWGFAKKVIIKSQRQFMYGSNFYVSDVTCLQIEKNGILITDERVQREKNQVLKVAVLFYLVL